MLKLHILHLKGQKLAVFLAESHYLCRLERVNMHLYAFAVLNHDKRVAVDADILDICIELKALGIFFAL